MNETLFQLVMEERMKRYKKDKTAYFNQIRNLLLWLIVIIGSNLIVIAQDSESTLPPELQRKVDEAEARKKIAEARKAELEATFPIPDPESLRTATDFKEIKGEFIETRIQGYQAMANAAQKVACRIRGTVGNNVSLVVYRPEEAAMIRQYLSVMDKRNRLEERYKSLIKETDALQAEIAQRSDLGQFGIQSFDGGGIGAVANLVVEFIGLFKRQETFSPTLFDIGDKELLAVFFDKFRTTDCQYPNENSRDVQFYYPGVIPITLSPMQPASSDLWSGVIELDRVRTEAENKLATFEESFSGIQSLISELETMPANQRDEKQNAALRILKKIERLKFEKDVLRELYKGFLKEIGIPFKEKPEKPEQKPEPDKPSSTTQTTTVTVNVYNKEEEKKKNNDAGGGNFFALLDAEKLYKLMSDTNRKGYWIQMSVSKAGGNVRVVSIPIVDIFAGSRVRFSGGSIISYNVFGLDGQSILSGVTSSYEKYTSSKKIEKSLR
ncbi:MAG TPA: hypothetical protein VF571_08480 [Pyrinomonadaceae bacterium]